MSHTYTANLLHVVFSTKHRRDLIPSAFQPRLWGYMAEIGRNRAMHILVVGGIANHVHVLLSLPAVMPLAKAAQALKGISSEDRQGVSLPRVRTSCAPVRTPERTSCVLVRTAPERTSCVLVRTAPVCTSCVLVRTDASGTEVSW